MFIVWFLTGMWHGAAWNFILWGLYYFIFLLIEKTLLKDKLEKIPKFFRWLITFIIVVTGWMIFRSNNLTDLVYNFKNMFIITSSDWQTLAANNLSSFNFILYLIPAIIFSFPVYKKLEKKAQEKYSYTILENIIILFLFGLSIMFLVSSTYNPFIYFRF